MRVCGTRMFVSSRFLMTVRRAHCFFHDPYSRLEDKRGGAWMDSERGRSKVLDSKPVAYLTCNGSRHGDTLPTTFREVETLFHETGHGLRHAAEVEDGDAAGINNVEGDALSVFAPWKIGI